MPVSFPLRGGRRSVTAGRQDATDHDTKQIAALRKAHAMVSRDDRGQPIVEVAPTSPYERRMLQLAFLAPDIQQAILAGRQPRGLNLERLIHQAMPICWSRQRQMLGFFTAC